MAVSRLENFTESFRSIMQKHGLSILPEKEVAKSKSPAQRDAERKGTSWKKETQMAVDAALEVAENHTEFFG